MTFCNGFDPMGFTMGCTIIWGICLICLNIFLGRYSCENSGVGTLMFVLEKGLSFWRGYIGRGIGWPAIYSWGHAVHPGGPGWGPWFNLHGIQWAGPNLYTPRRLNGWNPKIMIWSLWCSSSRGVCWGSMFIFEGVSTYSYTSTLQGVVFEP